MFDTSPICREWLRATFTPLLVVFMLFLGRHIAGLPRKSRNGISVAAVLLAILSVAAYRAPTWLVLGAAVNRVGGAVTVAGCVILLLVGIARAEKTSIILALAFCIAFAMLHIFALSPLYWHYLARNSIANYPNSEGMIKQSTGVTCVPAAASMLLNRYGFRVSEGMLAERAGTNPLTGTDHFSIAKAMNSIIQERGFKARVGHLNYDQGQRLNRPFIACIKLPNLGYHEVAVISLSSDAVYLYDPLFGRDERLPASDFISEWSGSAVWISGMQK